MDSEKDNQVKEVFAFYVDYLKPLYCEIEATDNKLPSELLFEIHAAFDHLRRIYVDENDPTNEAHKACGHLKRAALDAYKLKLKYFNKELKKLDRVDLTLIDNGQFYDEYQKDIHHIHKLGKEARLIEGKNNPEDAFTLWDQTSIAINDFSQKYFNDPNNIKWARRKTVYLWCKGTGIAFCIGIITGIISSLIVGKFNK